ncbi:hypothetical protein CfE428DRAFT_5265 [Chthoniobacter flavus Ellin428]|uniref:Uncharacterized protein n=1 Tax=Chthoniobacter flavus Ellin428 TaxID=497964 RepID=B4D8M5_9BACT|nr:hypothetical protein [Chthoniobacter flavus]EDY17247.1 hypothetical protein CfE428DRAFT_5265 [Chthoniobacter flavus Ellin428]TCO86930.1 hypothetical protein EV701_12525 [Chthoniobacter flavus]
MAWRIHDHILRGEIDNRTRCRVTGRIWLAGLDEPLTLDLEGDCHPDLAGCLLEFENPTPIPLKTRPPALRQYGTAGEITAARKVRVFDVPVAEAYVMAKRGEQPPEHMANCLYVEWFSERSGAVVIESTDYRLKISAPVWRFTAEEIAERKRQAEEGDSFTNAVDADGTAEKWDEFRCEQLLRESDMTGEKYRRLLEKYADHPDSERIIAREMGWTSLEEMLAEEEAESGEEGEENQASEDDEEGEEDELDEFEEVEEEPPDPEREGIDWVHDEDERVIHPVAKHARDVMRALLDELKEDDENLRESDDALGAFSSQFMILSVKLCSALGFIARGDRYMDPCMIIAWLKRALEIHNEVLTAADAITDYSKFPVARLAYYRQELFRIREEVLAIIGQLRRSE